MIRAVLDANALASAALTNATPPGQIVDAWLAGEWARAYDLLRRMPPEDRVSDFLTGLIVRHDRRPPPDFKGFVALLEK